MAKLQRYLILALTALASLGAGRLHAAEREPAFKALIVSEGRDTVGDMFYDIGGRQIRFIASSERLSRPYAIPPSGKVELYRETPPVPPATAPVKTPVTTLELKAEGRWLVLLNLGAPKTAGGGRDVRARVIDASIEKIPHGTVSIYNFCRTTTALQTDGASFELPVGQSRQIPYPSAKTHIWLKCAVLKNGEWSLELSSAQTVVPGNTRAIWLLFEQPGTPNNPQTSVALKNLIEPLPVPDGKS